MSEDTRPTFHPAANLFPMLSETDLEALAKDIKENGQEVPIVMFDGKILDGRNRWLACERARIIPKTVEWIQKNGESPIIKAISLNLHRRHLDASQRAMTAAEVLPMLEEEAKARQVEAGNKIGSQNLKQNQLGEKIPTADEIYKRASDSAPVVFNEDQARMEAAGKATRFGGSTGPGKNFPTPDEIYKRASDSAPVVFNEDQARVQRLLQQEQQRTAAKRQEEVTRLEREQQEKRAARAREEAAKAFKVNDRYVQDAKAIKQAAPDVAEVVKAGVVKLQDAKQLVRLPEPKRAEVIQQVQAGSTVKQAIAKEVEKERQQAIREEVSEGQVPVMLCSYKSNKPDIRRLTNNAVVYMQVTPHQTAIALEQIKETGLVYMTNFVIIDGDQHRLLLAARRGLMRTPILEQGHTVIRSGVYDAIQQMSEGPYLDTTGGNARGWLK